MIKGLKGSIHQEDKEKLNVYVLKTIPKSMWTKTDRGKRNTQIHN